jgi:hypothetical protein
VRAVNLAVSVQNLEVFADRNLRSLKVPREFGDQHTALPVQNIQTGTAAFFVQQSSFASLQLLAPARARFCFLFPFIAFYFVCPLEMVCRARLDFARSKTGSGHILAPNIDGSDPLNPVFVISWEPRAVITNQIPATEIRLFTAEVLP